VDDQLRANRSPQRVAMNPDVFITIVFVGIAVLAAFLVLVLVVPDARREAARVARHEERRSPRGRPALWEDTGPVTGQ
jgi:hypothetical protein